MNRRNFLQRIGIGVVATSVPAIALASTTVNKPKGVLMVPVDQIPEGVSPEDFAEKWKKFDGVVMYQPSRTITTEEVVMNQLQHGRVKLSDVLGHSNSQEWLTVIKNH